jgi:hypothetical protein
VLEDIVQKDKVENDTYSDCEYELEDSNKHNNEAYFNSISNNNLFTPYYSNTFLNNNSNNVTSFKFASLHENSVLKSNTPDLPNAFSSINNSNNVTNVTFESVTPKLLNVSR